MADEDRAITLGQLTRTCRGATLLLEHLAYDATILHTFNRWCAARGITEERFERVWQGTPEDATQMLLASQRDDAIALAQLQHLVHDELQSPLPWLPSALLSTFQLWVTCGVLRQPRRILLLAPDAVSEVTLEPGRGPRDDFARDIAWYCRMRLKRPADLPATLLREWKTQHPEITSGESLITQARDRVHGWLNVPIHFSWDPADG